MIGCTWRRRVLLAVLYCPLEAGHQGDHKEEVLTQARVEAAVLRDFVVLLSRAEKLCLCVSWPDLLCPPCAAKKALGDAAAAAERVRTGEDPGPCRCDPPHVVAQP